MGGWGAVQARAVGGGGTEPGARGTARREAPASPQPPPVVRGAGREESRTQRGPRLPRAARAERLPPAPGTMGGRAEKG